MNGLDHLTIPQLETAAADLRNAARVVEHTGHVKGALIDVRDGSVCAAGAIDLATFRRLSYIDTPILRFLVMDSCDDQEHYRAEIAYTVLADFLPDELCSDCDWAKRSNCLCGCNNATPWERVTHYNDAHCPGGPMLVNMLRLAAERADLAVYDKRRLLTGPVLVTA